MFMEPTSGETTEDGTEISAHLHGNDPEMILFIDPNKKGLGVVMENPTTSWPVATGVRGLKFGGNDQNF
jgi:hypothetical protein